MRFWQFWILVIAVATGPWFGLTSNPQWDRVTWVPFTGAEDKPKDIVVNLALFLPLGWTLMSKHPGARRMILAVGVACAVSVAIETTQLFCVLRDPSATDVLMNTSGAALGAIGSLTWSRRPVP